jgi:hypothetical protein
MKVKIPLDRLNYVSTKTGQQFADEFKSTAMAELKNIMGAVETLRGIVPDEMLDEIKKAGEVNADLIKGLK